MTQVGGNYEEHHHRYVRGWQYLRGTGLDDHEMDLAEHAFVDVQGTAGSSQVGHAIDLMSRSHGRRPALVLLGGPGTGRRAAALRILCKAGVPRERIRWLLLDWDQPRIEQVPHTKGYGFVLDLTSYPELPEDFYTGLTGYQKEAESTEAFLIILATPENWGPRTLATVPTVSMSRPPARKVAETHLLHLAPHRADWLTTDPLDTLLSESASPSDAARLARLIAQAHDDAEDSVKEEFSNWQDHLKQWFTNHSGAEDLRERALLIAVALLEGAPAKVVLEAADELFSDVGGQLPPGGPLAGRDLVNRLATVHASLIQDEGVSLEAERHGLAEAVLTHVWQQRPQLRKALLEWASSISAPNGTAVSHLPRIAECLVHLSAQPGGRLVLTVASNWVATGRSAHRQLATEVLETMALHPVTGPGVRKQLYDWAQQKTTSKELASAVAGICAGQLSRSYPRVALTRLRLLASRSDGLANEAVANAVRSLASAPEQRLLVLSEIIGWTQADAPAVREAGASTFLALTDMAQDTFLPPPARVEGDDADTLTHELFVQGWRAAHMETTTTQAAHDRLAAWLDSPHLSDDQVLPLAVAVLRGRLGQQGAAELLVGSSSSSDLGRARRKMLFNRLISDQTTSHGAADADPDLDSDDALALT
ncbi:hypothetical protein [Streptomyces sp. NPDC026673]|uniref:hypothetical protein n=1 Tax=Streptomyces sp. NPDC026673 TaxID=3155724 RepID=UPI0033D08C38